MQMIYYDNDDDDDDDDHHHHHYQHHCIIIIVIIIIIIISGAPRPNRACGAPWVNKSTHSKKIGYHVIDRATERPSVRTTGIPMFTLALSSYVGSPGESWLQTNVFINWQLSKQGIRWPVSPDLIAGSGVDPWRWSVFLKLSADNLLFFKWSQAHVYFLKIHIKYVFMSVSSRIITILISNWP